MFCPNGLVRCLSSLPLKTGFVLLFFLVSLQAHAGDDWPLFCPWCGEVLPVDKDIFENPKVKVACISCGRDVSPPDTAPPGHSSASAREEGSQHSDNLNLTFEIRGGLSESGNNMVFSPTGVMNSVTPILRPAGLPPEIEAYAEQHRQRLSAPPQTEIVQGEQPGGRGLRARQIFATTEGRQFSPAVLSRGGVPLNYTPEDQNQAIREAIRNFIQDGFSQPSRLSIPEPTFNANAVFGVFDVITFDGQWQIPMERRDGVFFRQQDGSTYLISSIGYEDTLIRYSRWSDNESLYSDASNFSSDSFWQMVELPYRLSEDHQRFRMRVVLPPVRTDPGQLTANIVRQLTQNLAERSVQLNMPTFNMTNRNHLSAPRQAGILTALFRAQNFNPDAVIPRVSVDGVDAWQSISFLTDIEGSQAAAVTSGEILECCIYCPDRISVRINRPYTTLVVDSQDVVHIFADVYRPDTGL
ncbi:serpin family protein [Endozoicomonas euniceicola]|uniref:Serpin domain-containing protein n=1 Tax=Endozoicomonas euniceicola TaxID=1234143 RepID=A0ABY6GRK1_9GAMM|nr:serpin family protein [Endozoicomonas euniceicola]UYM14686.1 hypothetical protein NX720_17570 [Endozoicomonas euniceicola]